VRVSWCRAGRASVLSAYQRDRACTSGQSDGDTRPRGHRCSLERGRAINCGSIRSSRRSEAGRYSNAKRSVREPMRDAAAQGEAVTGPPQPSGTATGSRAPPRSRALAD
jgi:hypothetical protein